MIKVTFIFITQKVVLNCDFVPQKGDDVFISYDLLKPTEFDSSASGEWYVVHKCNIVYKTKDPEYLVDLESLE